MIKYIWLFVAPHCHVLMWVFHQNEVFRHVFPNRSSSMANGAEKKMGPWGIPKEVPVIRDHHPISTVNIEPEFIFHSIMSF